MEKQQGDSVPGSHQPSKNPRHLPEGTAEFWGSLLGRNSERR